ncbi:hypothetical protein Psch_02999 [Pelotomaculum schinkii]|uniref:N-acetyltransferase domain-containing protein n=1 Tax=Pelotomaculum schinkii TaxID=78350 RepID=A0A4Y7RCA4_9FIRM|nr:hypothetical protein Psch_02999 [Pelotomaculum schinkii]
MGMYDLIQGVTETEKYFGDKLAVVYKFGWGIKIIGFKYGNHLDLRVLTIGNNHKRKGLGEGALRQLRPRFKTITVNEIYEEALPFWLKMKERGLIDHIGTVKLTRVYDHVDA